MPTSWPFLSVEVAKTSYENCFENRSPALVKLLIMQGYSESNCSFVFFLNEKPVFLFPLFFLFYTSLRGKVGFIVTYKGYINCCILVNSVLQSLLSALIQTRNVPVERWRKYETNFIMELQPKWFKMKKIEWPNIFKFQSKFILFIRSKRREEIV